MQHDGAGDLPVTAVVRQCHTTKEPPFRPTPPDGRSGLKALPTHPPVGRASFLFSPLPC